MFPPQPPSLTPSLYYVRTPSLSSFTPNDSIGPPQLFLHPLPYFPLLLQGVFYLSGYLAPIFQSNSPSSRLLLLFPSLSSFLLSYVRTELAVSLSLYSRFFSVYFPYLPSPLENVGFLSPTTLPFPPYRVVNCPTRHSCFLSLFSLFS